MALAYPKDDSSLSRRITRDYFLTALDDPELKIKVREREPPELQTAYKTAIRLETLKKASSSREAATAVTSKKTIKPSKAARAVQELADHLSLEIFKEEMTRQMNDWKAEKQREIKELQAENSRLRQNSQPKPSDLATVSAPGWAWAAILADGVKRDFSKLTCLRAARRDIRRLSAGKRACRRQDRLLRTRKRRCHQRKWRALSVERKTISSGTVR